MKLFTQFLALSTLLIFQADAATTCTTSAITPSPTANICGQEGYLKFASPSEESAVPAANPTPVDVCRTRCFNNSYCKSFSYAAGNRTCGLYNQAPRDAGFRPVPGNGVAYWSRLCFNVTCTDKDCVPVSGPQIVTNPSFETGTGQPWTTNGSVTRIQDSSAYNGQYVYRMDAHPGTDAVLNQKLSGLNTSRNYIFRVAYRVVANTLQQDDVYYDFCSPYVKLDTLTLSLGPSLDAFFPVSASYGFIETEFVPPKKNFVMSFGLTCTGEPSHGIVLLVDSVSVVSPADNCPFALKAIGGGKAINNRYFVSSSSYLLFITPNFASATAFYFDPTMNMVYYKNPSVTVLTLPAYGDSLITTLVPSTNYQGYVPLNCSIASSTKALSCSSLGNTQLSICGQGNGYPVGALTGNTTCSYNGNNVPIAITVVPL